MVYFDNYYFNKYLFMQFDSTLGRFVGFNEYGMKLAAFWNSRPLVQEERAVVDWYCKGNAKVFDSAICEKSGKWHKTLLSFLLSTCRAYASNYKIITKRMFSYQKMSKKTYCE